jgi:hypothetical protein
MKLNPKVILQADNVNVTLENDYIELGLDDGQKFEVSYNDLSIAEALLLKLKFADPVILPGKSTSDIFKSLESKE